MGFKEACLLALLLFKNYFCTCMMILSQVQVKCNISAKTSGDCHENYFRFNTALLLAVSSFSCFCTYFVSFIVTAACCTGFAYCLCSIIKEHNVYIDTGNVICYYAYKLLLAS